MSLVDPYKLLMYRQVLALSLQLYSFHRVWGDGLVHCCISESATRWDLSVRWKRLLCKCTLLIGWRAHQADNRGRWLVLTFSTHGPIPTCQLFNSILFLILYFMFYWHFIRGDIIVDTLGSVRALQMYGPISGHGCLLDEPASQWEACIYIHMFATHGPISMCRGYHCLKTQG